MNKTIQRRRAEKELRLAEGYILTREAYETRGARYMGPLSMAAKAGYYTPAGCARLGAPVTPEELANIGYFAIFADCYPDQMLQDGDGNLCRPCLPVFYRGTQQPKEAGTP